MSVLTDVIGYMAAIVGTFLMMPQVLRALRTKSMKDVSMYMLFAYIINCMLWDTYGILLGAVPMILCNTIALGIGIWQVILKRKYG